MPNQFHRVTFTWDALRVPYMGTLHPGIPYWTSVFQMQSLEKLQHDAGVRLFRDEGLAPVPYWRGEVLKGHVAYYHDGALGDELIHSTFQRQVVLDHPGARLHLISKSRGPIPLLPGNRYVGEYPFPWGPYIPESAAQRFETWVAPAPVGYMHRGSDENIYDLIEQDCGISPDTKRPYAYVQGMARDEIRESIVGACANFRAAPPEKRAMPPDFWQKLILVQLNASEVERTPTRWHERLSAIVEAVGNRFYVAIVGDETVADSIMAQGPIRVYAFLRGEYASPSPLALMVLAEAASVMICPDSFMLHAAAAWGVPTIALWNMEPGAVTADGLPIPPPQSRMGTYPNVTVLDKDGPSEETVTTLKQIIGG